MRFSEEFILMVNRKNVSDILPDKSNGWYYSHHRSYINSLIKLGYVERIEWDELKKLKDIPEDLHTEKARELTKGMKLPRKQVASTWGYGTVCENLQKISKIYENL
jgi:hypothetical protein